MNSQEAVAQTRTQTRRRLAEAGPQYQKLQLEVARLLRLCQEHNFWAPDYKSFSEYVEDEVGLKLRTAQALIKTVKICEKLGISDEVIQELGWSKVSQVAGRMNAGNRDEVLNDIKSSTLSELKQKYRKQPTGASGKSSRSVVQITAALAMAIDIAQSRTKQPDIQVNLDFIAQRFVESTSLRKTSTRSGEMN